MAVALKCRQSSPSNNPNYLISFPINPKLKIFKSSSQSQSSSNLKLTPNP